MTWAYIVAGCPAAIVLNQRSKSQPGRSGLPGKSRYQSSPLPGDVGRGRRLDRLAVGADQRDVVPAEERLDRDGEVRVALAVAGLGLGAEVHHRGVPLGQRLLVGGLVGRCRRHGHERCHHRQRDHRGPPQATADGAIRLITALIVQGLQLLVARRHPVDQDLAGDERHQGQHEDDDADRVTDQRLGLHADQDREDEDAHLMANHWPGLRSVMQTRLSEPRPAGGPPTGPRAGCKSPARTPALSLVSRRQERHEVNVDDWVQ